MLINFHDLNLTKPDRPYKLAYKTPVEPKGESYTLLSEDGKSQYTLPLEGVEVCRCRREAGRNDLTMIEVKQESELVCVGKKDKLTLGVGVYYLGYAPKVKRD